jgi:hypothetical protein
MLKNTNNQFELISNMLINHCQENNSFAYNIVNNNMIGFGIVDKSNQFYTNLSVGTIPYLSSSYLEYIKPKTYISVIIVRYQNQYGFIWSSVPIVNKDELLYVLKNKSTKSTESTGSEEISGSIGSEEISGSTGSEEISGSDLADINSDNFKLYNLPTNTTNLINLLSESDSELKIYGLKNKLLYEAKFINNFSQSQLKNSDYIFSKLDIYFKKNNFEIQCIRDDNTNINCIVYDENIDIDIDSATNIDKNIDKNIDSDSDTYSDTYSHTYSHISSDTNSYTNSYTDTDSETYIDIDTSDEKISRIEIIINNEMYNLKKSYRVLNKQINQIVKKYRSTHNLIINIKEDTNIMLNQYIRSNNLNIHYYNLFFEYNYPIEIY